MRILRVFPNGKTKVLTMSYDDGKLSDERLVAIFNKYGIKGTFNLNFSLLNCGDPGRVPLDRLLDVYRGHEIATHTLSHPVIARCPAPQIYREILEDKKGWESITGAPVRGHAYPCGSFSEEVKRIFKDAGIVYGRTVRETLDFELPTDWMEWDSTCHHTNPMLMDLAKTFVAFNKPEYLKMMYVWGHSYEFDDDSNWDKIEEFCAYVGGRQDIWYATNIEIRDYMDAYDRLQFAADESFAYNPNAIDLWVAVGMKMKPVKIPAGCTVKLDEGITH